MIERQEEPIVGKRIRAEEVFGIDARIHRVQLPPDSLFCFDPSERAAKISIVESSTRRKKAIEGSRDILEIGQALQSIVAIQTERIIERQGALDRKSTRLNSSHLVISYAVFCLKKKT